MHLGDSIFILILALVLLGPKKTAELAQHLGKLMAEFRKASNDFKFQFNEEMRVAEQQEQKKKQEEERAALPAGDAAEALPADSPATALGEENSILHPPSGPPADGIVSEAAAAENSEAVPYAISATTGEEHPVEDHPLLRVDVIPPMDGTPADQTSPTAQTPEETVGEAGRLAEIETREENGASVHHG